MNGITRLSQIELKLVQVQVFFRHGARTPLHLVNSPLAHAEWTTETTKDIPEINIPMEHVDIFKRTSVDDSTFDLIYTPIKLPGGEAIGMLTSIGQKDLFDFGKQLKKLYGGILSNPPKLSDVEVRSTRVGRNLKSVRSVIAGIFDSKIDGTLIVPSMSFEDEVLFPNPKLNEDESAYFEGCDELKDDKSILELKEKIKKALKVDRLIDELDNDVDKKSKDCRVYYVRDDYAARKHNGFEVPPTLQALERDMDHVSAVELLNELLGKRANWKSRLDINIGAVIHLILSKMHDYKTVPKLQLVAVHDSTILPMLLALDYCDEMWPLFGADIAFELYTQANGPDCQLPKDHVIPETLPNSSFKWSEIPIDRMWVRVLYLNKPIPLLSKWCDEESIAKLTGSKDYIPLKEFIRRMTPISLSVSDYRAKCQEQLKIHHIQPEPNHIHQGPKNM